MPCSAVTPAPHHRCRCHQHDRHDGGHG
jgi:hypothetical protein